MPYTLMFLRTQFYLSCGRRHAVSMFFFFQAEDGIRDLVRSRGLGDVYKRQMLLGDGAHSVSALLPR